MDALWVQMNAAKPGCTDADIAVVRLQGLPHGLRFWYGHDVIRQFMEAGKVLIVEDENIVALDMRQRLTKLGYEVVGTASSGKRALELVEKHSPHIILMDIHIKGSQDGIEVAQAIKQTHRIPIIFLTAYSEDSILARARQSEPYGYLLKPFTERELHVAIQVALDKHGFIQQLAHREAHLKLAVNAAQLSTWETDVNAGAIIMGYSAVQALQELTWPQLEATIVASDRDRVRQGLARLQRHPHSELDLEFQMQAQNQAQTQARRWFRLCGKSFSSGRTPVRVVGVLQEVTEQKRAREKLLQADIAFRCSVDGIVVLNRARRIESVNQSFLRITGSREADCVGSELALISEKNLGAGTYAALWESLHTDGSWQGEARFHDAHNRLIHALINIGLVPDPDISEIQYVVVVSDITPIRHVQKELAHAAYYDALTGLPNRHLFYDRLDTCLSQASRRKFVVGLMYLDLDQFKWVNDTLGHQMGDDFLRAVALRLRSVLRSCDTLCRWGGDEFTIIVHQADSTEELEALARKLLTVLARPLRIGNSLEVVPRASIGISLFPEHTRDRDEMVRMADIAMYSAKKDSTASFAFFQPFMSTQVAAHFNREQELHRALKEDELRLFYQPQFDSDSGALVGVEALIRWQHPLEGLLGAGEVIPFAESSSLILEIGKWVFNEVCRQLACWLADGFDPKRISINVSARQLEDREFGCWVSNTVEQHQVSYRYLDVEVTESCLQDNETGISNLFWLRDKGANISIDDFGTGYSCMQSLKSLPITALKIDQAFVRCVHRDESDKAICNAIIALSSQLGLRTIAEGVETEAQAEFLRRAGCNELQGFLLGKPQPVSAVTPLLPRSRPD
ncbi:EAL domain-containing protein [Ketobacter sp.]|uniref:two-component system response regulator n=1 Tax=Ketobacter sp. TaxID=2083498 RepID=UPI000F2076CB|nr:EAL domain-containing protein [Ketobacter sp.]RLT96966.1 MAG: EAL domain-containing protein [Ketobacter sp.]